MKAVEHALGGGDRDRSPARAEQPPDPSRIRADDHRAKPVAVPCCLVCGLPMQLSPMRLVFECVRRLFDAFVAAF